MFAHHSIYQSSYKVHKVVAAVGKQPMQHKAEDDHYAGYLPFMATRCMLATVWHLALGLDGVRAFGNGRLVGFCCSRGVCARVPPKVQIVVAGSVCKDGGDPHLGGGARPSENPPADRHKNFQKVPIGAYFGSSY